MTFITGAIALFLSVSLFANQTEAKPITIMAYNVENFFDTVHDEGTEDYAYLPLEVKKTSKEVQGFCKTVTNDFFRSECFNLDWSEKVLTNKITNIAKVIKSFSITEKGPDIVILEEIENLNSVNNLAGRGLAGLYKYRSLTEGDDTRGISIGVLSKYPIVSTLHHSTFVKGKKLNTRGILEVTIKVNGKLVTIFGNHWPSQSNPVSERIASAEQLAKLAGANNSDLIIAVGDFNTIATDTPHPFHLLTNDFYDSEQEARSLNVKLGMPGTYNHKGKWDSLDRIFVHKNSNILPNWMGFQIVVQPWMMANGFPKRFNLKTGQGFSDHLPIVIEADI